MSVTLASRLDQITRREPRLVIGLMSGTSVDAISAVLCEISGGGLPSARNKGAQVKLRHQAERGYSADVRRDIQRATELSLAELAELNLRIGMEFGNAVLDLLDSAEVDPRDVAIIGSHGQTVYHHSGKRDIKATMQLGDGDQIANLTGIVTISDFRTKDIVYGGEGAPLTPYADMILFQGNTGNGSGLHKAVLNLGGSANITVFTDRTDQIIGFDTGPANSPLDRIASRITRGKANYDLDGAFARAGAINQALLDDLLATDQFLVKPPPRSTGFEAYGDEFIERIGSIHGGFDNDLMATVVEFIAISIERAIEEFIVPRVPVGEVILAGGGSDNSFLVERISAHLTPIEVTISDKYGVPSRAREAMAFAILANDTLLGIPSSLPSVTGAEAPAILGKISVP